MNPFAIGATVLGSVLGGSKRPSNPFKAQMDAQAGELSGIGNQYAGMARTAQTRNNIFRKRADQSLDEYGDYLQQDPFTDSYSARALGQATDGTNAAYEMAKSNLAATNARRGLSGDSSAQVGGDAAIEAARAGSFANAENNLAMSKVANRGQRLGQLNNLYDSAADGEYNALQDATGRQTGIADQLLQFYTGQNNQANAQATSDYNSQLGGLSGLGDLLGGAFGFGDDSGNAAPAQSGRSVSPLLSPDGLPGPWSPEEMQRRRNPFARVNTNPFALGPY